MNNATNIPLISYVFITLTSLVITYTTITDNSEDGELSSSTVENDSYKEPTVTEEKIPEAVAVPVEPTVEKTTDETPTAPSPQDEPTVYKTGGKQKYRKTKRNNKNK
tara:strand:- start:26 stop:346 length:321 start_codon:yes stop_codon:yes gene_type:complete